MRTYTVFWSIDVELESAAAIEDHARYAAECCSRMNLADPVGANVFYVAAFRGKAARLLKRAGVLATRVDLGAKRVGQGDDHAGQVAS